MNRLSKVIVGLQIFEKHGGSLVCAEHDELFSGQADGVSLSMEEIQILDDAGWAINAEACKGECRESDDDPVGYVSDGEKHHPACNEWAHFT